MAAPPKPWEKRGSINPSLGYPADQAMLNQHVNQRSTTGLPNTQRNYHSSASVQRTPPPLPTRPSQQSSLMSGSMVNRYGYGGSYGGMGMGSYGGGMYGGYGGMYGGSVGGMYGGMGYGRGMGAGNEPYSRFVQQAEESSRPAFQSIESIVQAFASVSMMLESTFHTVYNSFRAVLGVAEHFSRLKIHLAKIFSAIALFRFLRYIYRKLLVLLGLRTHEFAEEIWLEAESQAAEGAVSLMPSGGKQKRAPSWPIFMFFAVVVGGPYIIWKLLSSSEEEPDSCPEWAAGEEDHVVGRAEFDFDGDSEKELSFHSGDVLNLAPKDQQPKVRGWLLASKGGEKIGLVPANYVKILGKRRGRKYAPTTQEGNPLNSSQSMPHLPVNQPSISASGSPGKAMTASNLQSSQSSTDFGHAFTASSTPGDMESSFLAGQSSNELGEDFVFRSDNVNNSNSSSADLQQDFVGFDKTFSSGSERKEPGAVEKH
ncbi:peroxisomal membrane protein PEX13-like isoform X1 [Lytechinus variegatus]|uniref:peroxisomal membrane protein PEX13-like isoform X1 n=1 Tax=Lytechinus variegatus TaxID=7654 RepID=UPI001BB2694F|nr:peroxisomal membrane protein PEX13-like isoform X1 [Lytechinus variegatus]